MACGVFDLVQDSSACYAIIQGSTLNWLTFYYPADVSAWTASGQIRRNYADSDSLVLAAFSFDSLTYGTFTVNGASSQYTQIRPILTNVQTQGLPITTWKLGDEYKAGKNIWVYDLEIRSPGDTVVKVSRGVVQVLPEVTR